MTYRVVVQPRAERDIRAAAQWIAAQSKSATPTLRWVRGIRLTVRHSARRGLAEEMGQFKVEEEDL